MAHARGFEMETTLYVRVCVLGRGGQDTKQQHGGCMNSTSIFSFRICGDN
jgi:hypothetical protein